MALGGALDGADFALGLGVAAALLVVLQAMTARLYGNLVKVV